MENSHKFHELLNEPLEVLSEYHKFSVRAYNICLKYKLNSLNQLLNYYIEHRDFLKLYNIGAKTNAELSDLCLEILEDSRIQATHFNKFEIIKYISDRLSPDQLKIMNLIVIREILPLNVGTRNILNRLFENKADFPSLIKTFFRRSKSLELESSGRKTADEIVTLVDMLEHKALKLLELNDEQIHIIYIIEKLIAHFNLKPLEIENYKVYLMNGRFPIFKFIYWLLVENKGLDKREMAFLRHRSGYFLNEKILTMEEVAIKFDITVERMRQISVIAKSNLSHILMQFYHLKQDLAPFLKYPLDLSTDIFCLPLDFSQNINDNEGCQFKPKFIIKVLGHLHFDLYDFVSFKLDYVKNDYLVSKILTTQFDFNSFFKALDNQLVSDIDKDYSINFENYYLPFFIGNKDFSLYARIRNVCERLIAGVNTEGVEFDIEGNIILKRNTLVRRYELIKDILQQHGETMTLEEIYEKYIETYPQFLGISIGALKVHMKKRKDVFVYLIRNSTYGLIDWKYEAQDVIDFEKMTIVDLVQKYLEQHEVPKHSFEITEYVLQFYPSTNLTSIYTSMLDRKHRFKDFGNRFWGLHSKKYDSFISRQLPKFLHKSIREYWKKHPEATQFEIIEALATRYNIYPSQVQYSMQLFMTKSAEFKNN